MQLLRYCMGRGQFARGTSVSADGLNRAAIEYNAINRGNSSKQSISYQLFKVERPVRTNAEATNVHHSKSERRVQSIPGV